MRRIYAFVLLLLLLVSGCGRSDQEKALYHGTLELDSRTLSAPLAGKIDTVLISEGSRVEPDQLLLSLDATMLEIELERLQAQYEEILLTQSNLDHKQTQLQARLELLLSNLNRTRQLLAEDAVAASRLDELNTERVVLQSQLAELENNRLVFESKCAQLASATAAACWQREQCQLSAPVAGVVLELIKERGEWVAPGTPLLKLGDTAQLEATIYLPLADLPGVRIGDTAELQVDGISETFTGTVSWIADEVEFTPKTIHTRETRTALVCAVHLTVANRDDQLKAGMPVDVQLNGGDQE